MDVDLLQPKEAMRSDALNFWTSTDSGRKSLRIATAGTAYALLVFLIGWPIYSMDILGGRRAADYYIVVLAVAAVSAAVAIYRQPSSMDAVVREPLVWWVALYLVLAMLSRQFSPGDPAFLELIWRNRLVAFLCFIAVFVMARQSNVIWLVAALGFCLAFNVALYWVDVLNPGMLLPLDHPLATPGRATGFHLNANEAASALIVGGIALLAFAPPPAMIAIFVALLAGVVATFSRSGMIVTVGLVGFAIYSGLLSRKQALRLVSILVGLLIVYVTSFAAILALVGEGSENLLGRVLWFASAGKEVDSSAAIRFEAALHALDMFVEAPMAGAGFASTLRDWDLSPHNMYVMLAGEHGLLGVLWYVLLLGSMFRCGMNVIREARDQRQRQRGLALLAFFGYFVIQSLFSHNMLDRPFIYAALAVMLADPLVTRRSHRIVH